MTVLRKGQVWVANLNPNKGAEIGKIRPVLVMQDEGFDFLPTVVIIPLTTSNRPSANLVRPVIQARDDLREDCQACVDQIRLLDRSRFGDGPLTELTEVEMELVEKSLIVLLDVRATI